MTIEARPAHGAVRTLGATTAQRNMVSELEFTATLEPADPWAEIEMDVEFTDPDGAVLRVPAFWAGGRSWRVRYSSPIEGVHVYRTLVRSALETGLDGHEGELSVKGYDGANPLLVHGAPVVAADGTHLAHADGTPFLWLADTWWTATTARFRWPDVFQTLAEDRAAKGFNVALIAAGLPPEFRPWSRWMASEGGQPWQERGNGPINPGYWTVPDLKIDHLVGRGIVPCLVGGWGWWAGQLTPEKLAQHWRYVVARYAAYPVVWCVAGEVDMPGTVTGEGTGASDDAPGGLPVDQMAAQAAQWEELSSRIAEIDPYKRVRTVHPCPILNWSSSEVFSSRDAFDLDMLQTGHTGMNCVSETMEHLGMSLAHGDKPVINAECSYEGIFGGSWDDTQRFLFWSHMLRGAAGHTYGTVPICMFSSRDDPCTPVDPISVHRLEDALAWKGAEHLGAGKRILEGLPWWELTPAPDALERHASDDDWFRPYAARAGGGTIVVYLPSLGTRPDWLAAFQEPPPTLTGLTPGTTYRAQYVDPRTGEDHAPITFRCDDGGRIGLDQMLDGDIGWIVTPTAEDWVLVVTSGSA